MKGLKRWMACGWLLALLVSCSVQEPVADLQLEEQPALFPDYADVTIPATIAPLRFRLLNDSAQAVAVITSEMGKWVVKAHDGQFLLSEKQWRKVVGQSAGKTLQVTVMVQRQHQWVAYQPFAWHVSTDEIDPCLVYRLVEPGYELWNKMGIYERQLSSYEERALLVNTQFDHNCMNCHSFNQRNPNQMLFHMRAKRAGTYFVSEGEVKRISGKFGYRVQSLVYPYWHPSGRYVAFSTNTTRQGFHRGDPNRVEVFDRASDVLVYDRERDEVLTDSALASTAAFETFPSFSPDGKTLYFCSADTCAMPAAYQQAKYSLCAIGFDADRRTFVLPVDTLYVSATGGKSASFPRVSPDGRYLVYTLSSYGNFSIWHKDADLYLLDLETGESRQLAEVNSNDVESYHSWSSNSRWMVFSSRRLDGLHTRPYLVHLDEQGHPSKPFLLPQARPDYYDDFRFSYNIPELVNGQVNLNRREIIKTSDE